MMLVVLAFAGLKVVLSLGVVWRAVVARFWLGVIAAMGLATFELTVIKRVVWPAGYVSPYTVVFWILVALVAPIAVWMLGEIKRRGRSMPDLKEASELFVLFTVLTAIELAVGWLCG